MRPLTRTRPLTEAEIALYQADADAATDSGLHIDDMLPCWDHDTGGTFVPPPFAEPPPSRTAQIAARAILLLVIATGLFGIGALLVRVI